MSIENPNRSKQAAKAEISRRDFLRIIGGAVGAYAMPPGAAAAQESGNHASLSESGEVIPSPENVREIFNTLFREVTKKIGAENYTEVRKDKDDKGVYAWDVAFPIEGGAAAFQYMRKGRYTSGEQASATQIYITFFDENGVPEGGHDVAEFKDAKWEIGDILLPK